MFFTYLYHVPLITFTMYPRSPKCSLHVLNVPKVSFTYLYHVLKMPKVSFTYLYCLPKTFKVSLACLYHVSKTPKLLLT